MAGACSAWRCWFFLAAAVNNLDESAGWGCKYAGILGRLPVLSPIINSFTLNGVWLLNDKLLAAETAD